MAYSMKLVVSWGNPVFIGVFKELHEAVERAKFIHECNKCHYIIVVAGTDKILYDTRVPVVVDNWQKLGF